MNSNKNLFSIGEIAKSIDITRKIILNYEAKGLVKPDVKEGVTGNRYYSIDTFTQIRTIRIFQKLGLSLDEIRDYLNDKTDLQPLITRLESLRDELNLNIERLYERTNRTQNIFNEITVEAQTVFCRTYNSSSVSEKSEHLRAAALEAMRSYGTDTTKRLYFTEFGFDKPNEILYCVAIPPKSSGEYVKKIPSFRAISTFHHGAYKEFPEVHKKLISYAKENDISIAERVRHVYLEGPPQHKDPSKFITQVIIPING